MWQNVFLKMNKPSLADDNTLIRAMCGGSLPLRTQQVKCRPSATLGGTRAERGAGHTAMDTRFKFNAIKLLQNILLMSGLHCA